MAFSILPLVENLKGKHSEIETYINQYNKLVSKAKKDVFHLIRKSLLATRGTQSVERTALMNKYNEVFEVEKDNYSSHLYSQSQWKAEM